MDVLFGCCVVGDTIQTPSSLCLHRPFLLQDSTTSSTHCGLRGGHLLVAHVRSVSHRIVTLRPRKKKFGVHTPPQVFTLHSELRNLGQRAPFVQGLLSQTSEISGQSSWACMSSTELHNASKESVEVMSTRLKLFNTWILIPFKYSNESQVMHYARQDVLSSVSWRVIW